MRKRLILIGGAGFLVLALGLGTVLLPASGADANKAGAQPAAAKVASSRIVGVTVYPNSALVTREVDVPAGEGNVEVVVNPLPPQTVDSSLYSEGSDGIRVLTTRYRMRPVREDTREEVRRLQDEMKKLQMDAKRIQADISALQMNMQMISKMESFTATSAKTGDKTPVNSESMIALAKYVMESRAAKAKELVGLQQTLEDNTEQASFVRRQLQNITAGTNKVERDAVIVVDKVNAAAGKIYLNYLVSAASWRPQYKFRAGKDHKEAVQLEYLAAIRQHTGEDWSRVSVTLSTAQPMLNADPPELRMLAVALVPRGTPQDPMAPAQRMANMEKRRQIEQQIRSFRGQAKQDYLQKDARNAVDNFNKAAALQASQELLYNSREEVLAQVNPGVNGKSRNTAQEGPSVTYHLTTKLSVPSRHDEQVIEVAKLELMPEYFYKAVPVLTSNVYRQADLTNKSKYVLLPGEATMYQGTDFVGRMDLPLVAIGEEFTVGFGVDPQLQVARQMMDKERTTQGGNQVLNFQYRILVNSYKPEPITLQVWDRLPHTDNTESVGITLVKTTPEVSKDPLYVREDRPHNLLRWDLKIDPDMNGDKAFAVNYEFEMALDKQLSIGGLQTR